VSASTLGVIVLGVPLFGAVLFTVLTEDVVDFEPVDPPDGLGLLDPLELEEDDLLREAELLDCARIFAFSDADD